MNPDTGKQLTARLLKKDRVDVVTGIVFSNVMLAVAPSVLENQTFLVSANAGPGAFSGEGCNPYFYVASWQNDGYHEAAGQFANTKNFKSVVLLAPNYPAGKDALTGFKRLYKGQVIEDGDGGSTEGFQVHLGGSLGLDSAFGRKLRQHKVTGAEVGDYIERVVRNFTEQREPGERFAQWALRTDEAQLR
jgi:hypothetical protein